MYVFPHPFSSSRSLARRVLLLPFSQNHLKSRFPATSPSTRNIPPSVPKRLCVRMASGEQKFPPQKQETQPGKEHAMDPVPQFTSPDHNPSNKLQGKIALITGGDSGIGRAVCNLFALEGATMAFTCGKGQEDKDAKDTLEMINRAKSWDENKEPMAIPTDLGYDENCKKVGDGW